MALFFFGFFFLDHTAVCIFFIFFLRMCRTTSSRRSPHSQYSPHNTRKEVDLWKAKRLKWCHEKAPHPPTLPSAPFSPGGIIVRRRGEKYIFRGGAVRCGVRMDFFFTLTHSEYKKSGNHEYHTRTYTKQDRFPSLSSHALFTTARAAGTPCPPQCLLTQPPD